MDGIPSAAAAQALGPETLPYKPSDGVTLPRDVGERDSHAVDTHYGDASLPKEAPVDMPVMTPGDSAVHTERLAAQQALEAAPDGIPSPGLADRAF